MKQRIGSAAEKQTLRLQRVMPNGEVKDLEIFDDLVSWEKLCSEAPPDLFALLAASLTKHGADHTRIVASCDVRMCMDIQATRDQSDVVIELPDDPFHEADGMTVTGKFKSAAIYLLDSLD